MGNFVIRHRQLLILGVAVAIVIFLGIEQSGEGLRGQMVPGRFCMYNSCATCSCDQSTDAACYTDQDDCFVSLTGGSCGISAPSCQPPLEDGENGGCVVPEGTPCTAGCGPNQTCKCDGSNGNCLPMYECYYCETNTCSGGFFDEPCNTGDYTDYDECAAACPVGSGEGSEGGKCCTSLGCQDLDESTCTDYFYQYYADANLCGANCAGNSGSGSGRCCLQPGAGYGCTSAYTQSDCEAQGGYYAQSDSACTSVCQGSVTYQCSTNACVAMACNVTDENCFATSNCDNSCGGGSNNCGNVTAQCDNTTAGLGEYCGPISECCNSSGEVEFSGAVCGTGLTCNNGNNVSGVCISTGAECGNGTKEGDEECDDGNEVNTDACTNACEDAVCGDSIVQAGVEECDDGNSVDTDDCKNDCTEPVVASSSVVSSSAISSSISSVVSSSAISSSISSVVSSSIVSSPVSSSTQSSEAECGNGTREADEECDDGNENNNDGCTSECIEVICGDGVLVFNTNENCDDGNTEDGDGCSSECTIETIQPAAPEESSSSIASSTSSTTGDVNLCGNDPDICCIEGASQYCCQQDENGAENPSTVCWQAGQNPPPEACEAVDPVWDCSECITNNDCRSGELCFEGTCSLYSYSDTWVATEDFPVFAKAVDHSVVTIDSVAGKRFWDIFQEVGPVFSNSNIASGTGPGWVSESGDFPGTPSIGEFTHLVFNDKQWLIGGSDYGRAPRRTRDVWSSDDGITWQKHINALPTAIDRHTSVVFNNKIWIFGGAQGSNDIGDTIFVSPNGTSWTELGNLPEGLIYAESLVYSGAILILGGETDSGVSPKIWKSTGAIDANGIIWEEVGSNALDGLNFAKRPATVFGGRIWIVGRSTDDQPLTFFSEDGGETWEDAPDPETHVFGGTDLSVLDNKLWLIGSYDDPISNHAGNVHYFAALPKNTCNPTEFDNPYYCEEESSSSQSSEASVSSAISTTSIDTTSSATSSVTNSTQISVSSSVVSFALPPPPPPPTTNNPGSPGEGPDRIVCGDGRVNGREQCDDGNNRNRDGCSSSCELESLRSIPTPTYQPIPVDRQTRCGNGLVEANEDCDDGNTRNGDGCNSTCNLEPRLVTPADSVCGNGITEDGEACDLGSGNSDVESNTCRTDCQLPRCGDFVFDEGEACDNGPANSDTKPNACRTSCTLPACGDGTIDSDETCDDGNLNDGDGCSATCQVQEVLLAAARVCGDGILASPEECDDGNKRDDDGCSSSCLLEFGVCGDGIVQSLAGEQCENSLHDKNLPFQCINCLFASYTCGDGVIDAGEECDNGNLNSNAPDALCRPLCHLARCGDGIVDNQEECDDGNYINTDKCDAQCRDRSAVLGASTTTKPTDTSATPSVRPAAPQVTPQQPRNPSQMFFPTMPTGQPLPYQLPLAQLQPLIQAQGPIGDTGPAAVAVAASGMAAGAGWMRRKRKQ